MAAAHYFIEGNSSGEYVEGAGAWVNVTSRIVADGHQVSFSLKGKLGQLVVSPPRELNVLNNDGWWLDQPTVSGGDFEGRWAGRRVQLRLEKGMGVHTLGTYRISPDGLKTSREGTGTLRLEALTKILERGDASEAADGLGWYQSIPWPLALKKILLGEGTAQLASLPDCVLDYEYLDRGCSLLGRPGDYQAGQWERVDDVAVDVCWNSEDQVFCFATTQALYEWDPATGVYSAVTHSVVLGTTKDILRVWFKPWDGDGFYFVLTAVREVTTQSAANESGYYQPKDQAYKTNHRDGAQLWAHDHGTALTSLKHTADPCNVAPVIYRETCVDIGGAVRTDFSVGAESVFLDTQYRYFENLTIPFGQYVMVLFNRRDQAGEDPGSANAIIDQDVIYHVPHEDNQDPLYSWTAPSEDSYTLTPRAGAGDRQEFNMDDLRMGRGYYASVTTVTSNYDPDDATDAGARYSLGQGPLVDLSWPEYGLDDDTATAFGRWDCWLVHTYWSTASHAWGVNVRKVYNPSGTTVLSYDDEAWLMDQWTVPTFVLCDIKRDETWTGGAVIVGWFNYNTGDTYEFTDPKEGWKVRPAESGLAFFSVNLARADAYATFIASEKRLLTFTPVADLDGDTIENRYYWTTAPTYLNPGVVYHESGRWTPVAAGFSRSVLASGTELLYRIWMVCLDRSECIPDPVTGRTGTPYRMMQLAVHVDSGVDLIWNDDEGGGHDLMWRSALPPMGLTRQVATTVAETLGWDRVGIYFYNPADSGIYGIDADSGNRPQWLGRVQAADPFLQLGTLAVSEPGGDDPQLAGVTSPVFPLTAATRWPTGEYYAWLFGPKHGGRIPLLELSDLTKWQATGLVTQLADAYFYFNRSGVPQLKQTQLQTAGTPVLDLTPSDYKAAYRHDADLTNYATRAVNDVMPGDLSVTVRLTPKSEWNLSPGFSGLGLYPVNLDLMCIGGGMVSEAVPDDIMGRTNWAWRETGKRLQSKVSQSSSGIVLYMDGLADVEVGDFVTLGIDDQDLEIMLMSTALSVVFLTTSLSREYRAGDVIHLTKRAQAVWSHQILWDEAAGRYRGVGIVAEAAASGTSLMSVRSSHPFSEGCFFAVGRQGDDIGTNESDTGTLRCIRIRKAIEEGVEFDIIELEAVGGGGLTRPIYAGDPIMVWLNISPASRSVMVGQTGVLFTVHGGGGGDAETNTEKPVHEGDRITVSYPGLISKKNSNSKVLAQDFDSIRAHGKLKSKLRANRLMDHSLAIMDCQRIVSRGAEDRLMVELKQVVARQDAVDADFMEPMDVVRVTDDKLLPKHDDFTSKFMVIQHDKDTHGAADMVLEELPSAIQGRAADPALWLPPDLTNLELWLRADSLVREGGTDGQIVKLWLDEGPNGYNAKTSPTGANPTLVLVGDDSDIPVVAFDSSAWQNLALGDVELHDNSAGRGLFVSVIGHRQVVGDSPLGTYLAKYSSVGFPASRQWYMQNAAFSVQEINSAYDPDTTVATGGSEDWAWTYGVWTPSGNVYGYLNGVLNATSVSTVTDVSNTSEGVYIGGERAGVVNNLNGEIAEIIVTSKAPTAQDLIDLAAYYARQAHAPLVAGVFGAFSSGFSDGFE